MHVLYSRASICVAWTLRNRLYGLQVCCTLRCGGIVCDGYVLVRVGEGAPLARTYIYNTAYKIN
jgi:hypothetical protein